VATSSRVGEGTVSAVTDVVFGLEELILESVRIDRTIDQLAQREPSDVRDAMLLALRMRRLDILDKIEGRKGMDELKKRPGGAAPGHIPPPPTGG
jgi:hypothetical protein